MFGILKESLMIKTSILKCTVLILFSGCYLEFAYAVPTNTSTVTPLAKVTTTIVSPVTLHKSVENSLAITAESISRNIKESLDVNSAILKKIDQEVYDIDALKRQLEAEKLQSEINRTKSMGSTTNIRGSSNITNYGNTTVVDVFINKSGYRYATLQFIDDSVRDVEIGSRLGNYTVKAIDMNGVTLLDNNCSKTQCSNREIILERVYPKNVNVTNTIINRNNDNNPNNNTANIYQATPITGVTEESVPPIINSFKHL